MASLNLYTYKPLNVDFIDDDAQPFFIQGLMESLQDNTKNKLACFLELKREQTMLIEKIKNDLLTKRTGNFYRNHVLLDVLGLYKSYREELFPDAEGSSFDMEMSRLCADMVYCVFELFSCACESIIVFMRHTANEKDDVLVGMLNALDQMGSVKLIKIVDFTT